MFKAITCIGLIFLLLSIPLFGAFDQVSEVQAPTPILAVTLLDNPGCQIPTLITLNNSGADGGEAGPIT